MYTTCKYFEKGKPLACDYRTHETSRICPAYVYLTWGGLWRLLTRKRYKIFRLFPPTKLYKHTNKFSGNRFLMWYEILRRLIFQGIEGFGNTADSPSIWILPTRTKRKASSKWKINRFFILLCSMRKDNTRILSSFLNLQFNITWLFLICIKRRWENEFDIKKTETRSTDTNIQT